MKLLKFLSPKYSHPDPQVRAKTVAKMKDIPRLIDVLKKDPNPEVRNVAYKRIHELRPGKKKEK